MTAEYGRNSGGQVAMVTRSGTKLATETGSQMIRRLFQTELNLNSVAAVASALGTRVQGGRTLPELPGLGPFFFLPYPQFLGGVSWSTRTTGRATRCSSS
jgi:hypothetical protein